MDVRLARAGRSRVGEDVGKWDVRMSGSSHLRDFDLNLKDAEARYLYKPVENRLLWNTDRSLGTGREPAVTGTKVNVRKQLDLDAE